MKAQIIFSEIKPFREIRTGIIILMRVHITNRSFFPGEELELDNPKKDGNGWLK